LGFFQKISEMSINGKRKYGIPSGSTSRHTFYRESKKKEGKNEGKTEKEKRNVLPQLRWSIASPQHWAVPINKVTCIL
jgi:hypothetical protein